MGKLIHTVVDDYVVHKYSKARQWLARHLCWIFQFTPTSASWVNAVEGLFAKLTRQRLKRGVFRSVLICKSPSTASSQTQTPIPNPSHGRSTQNTDSPLLSIGGKRYSQPTTGATWISDQLIHRLGKIVTGFAPDF